MPNQSPEPTAVGACRSSVAVHVASRRWLSFFRSAFPCRLIGDTQGVREAKVSVTRSGETEGYFFDFFEFSLFALRV
jgi:hypothetical protein